VAQRRSGLVQLFGVPLVLAALAVGLLLVIVNVQVDPVMAEIEPTSVTVIDGEMRARIRWPAGEMEVHLVEVVIPAEYQTETTVPIDVFSDGTVEIRGSDQGIKLPPVWLMVIVALIGAMFGLVIVNSLRGYGFVRGTGEPGSMQPADVDEDRGFYWQS
jgi:hypothetical protein